MEEIVVTCLAVLNCLAALVTRKVSIVHVKRYSLRAYSVSHCLPHTHTATDDPLHGGGGGAVAWWWFTAPPIPQTA